MNAIINNSTIKYFRYTLFEFIFIYWFIVILIPTLNISSYFTIELFDFVIESSYFTIEFFDFIISLFLFDSY